LIWIRGHAQFGGNERVDRISKVFASIANNHVPRTVFDSFPASSVSRSWEQGFPLTALPVDVFLLNLPSSPTLLVAFVPVVPTVSINCGSQAAVPAVVVDYSGIGFVSSDGFTSSVLDVRGSRGEAKPQVNTARVSCKSVKPLILPTRRSVRFNPVTNKSVHTSTSTLLSHPLAHSRLLGHLPLLQNCLV
jgi:hypothetical protein